MKLTEQDVMNALSNVIDPELNISIVDLGLVYEANLLDAPESQLGQKVHIVMTLTTLGCPLFGTIEADVNKHVGNLGFAPDDIELELVFDPPWSMERMSESAKAMLGI